MDRIIEVKVSGNHITKDKKNAGVRGEANVTNLRITFDKSWDIYAKRVTFWDALGSNPVKRELGESPVDRLLTPNLLEDITQSTMVYIVPIPEEAMREAGMLTFVIDGFIDGKRQRSIKTELEVEYAPIADNASEPIDPTPDKAAQLQSQIDEIKGDIKTTKESAETAVKAANDASEYSKKAEATVGKSSYIGDNGNWFAWDIEKSAFYDTGVKAQAGSTVYYGDNPPDEADVWIDPDGESDNYYTKTEVDTRLGYKADKSDVYTKEETVSKINASGTNTTAKGINSHAEGQWTIARGNHSHAEGFCSEANNFASHAEGTNTKANGADSHSEGNGTQANGAQSHAEGAGTFAIGSYSHAEGLITRAEVEASHAEGQETIAAGFAAHAEGYCTEANGNTSHAEGIRTKVNGQHSHAEGAGTIASSDVQHVQGKNNIEDKEHKYAHIVGNGTSSARSNAHTVDWNGVGWFAGGIKVGGVSQDDENAFDVSVIKKSNINTSHLEGNETGGVVKGFRISQVDTASFEKKVDTLTQTIKVYLDPKSDPASIQDINNNLNEGFIMGYGIFGFTVEGKADRLHRGFISDVGTDDDGSYVVLQGDYYSGALDGLQANLNLGTNQGYSANSIVMALIINGGTIGSFEVIDDLNYFSQHTEGYKCTAGLTAHAENNETKALGYASHTEGHKTEAIGERGHAEGYKTKANGNESHAEGNTTEANGVTSHAEGTNTKAIGDSSHTEGTYTIAGSENQHVQGRYNIEDKDNKYAHIVGNGTSDKYRKNAHTLDWEGNAWFAGNIASTSLHLTSPNGTVFKLTVADDGTLTTTKI